MENDKTWIEVVKKYNQPDLKRSIWQIVNSLGPYVGLWILMYFSLQWSYWITLGISILAAGFMVRIFIIFHDCGHGSFFKSSWANRIVGTLLGSLVFTPYERWHRGHYIHHNTAGNLDSRGIGDVWTLTVEEYEKRTGWEKFIYSLYRHPIILFAIGPVFMFMIWFRFPNKSLGKPERRSVYVTNLILLVLYAGLILAIGWKAVLLIQLPTFYFAAFAGSWLFYVQHQYDDVVWTRKEDWDYKDIALAGCSYLKFPKVLQWFSGNIGFHHVHHLSPKIPNYKLEKCHKENEMFSVVKPVTFVPSMRSMRLKLWDEKLGQLISFRQFRRMSTA